MTTTLVSLWTEVRRRLEAAGVDTPVLDARLLLEAAPAWRGSTSSPTRGAS